MTPCRCRGVLLYHAECAGFVKMVISASGIFRVEPFQHRLCGDSPSTDGGNVPRPAAGQEGRHQGFYPLNSHFLLFVSLAQIRDRRPLRKRGTAEDFYYRRGAQCAPISLPLRSAGFRTATHIGSSTQARHIRVAQLVCSVVMDGICGFCLITDDTVACDLGAPLVTHLHLA